MGLPRDIYRALEDVVGRENISEELAILDSYAFQLMAELLTTSAGRFGFRPEAVVLPGSTEEVQAIVKTCNRYKIKFKAFSTGWGSFAGPGSEGVIQIDLRRMNRILEINERNMYAVVEPYVTGAQLHAELMKRGLTCNLAVSGGSHCSAAPFCSAADGSGWSGVRTSNHNRNMLGVEWVLPTGEVLRLGSLGSGAGWFCGDGPGPSLRGIMKGFVSAASGLGVYTKAATKIYHWPGPPVPLIEGVSPSYTLKPLPNVKAYCLLSPSLEKWADAARRIAESEIAYILGRVGAHWLAFTLATSNNEAAELYSKILESMEGQYGFLLVIIVANSQGEFEYQDKVLRQIVTDTGLKTFSFVDDAAIQGQLIWKFIRCSAGVRQYLRPARGFSPAFTLDDALDRLPTTIEVGIEFERKYREKGVVVDFGGQDWSNMWYEDGHLARTEQNIPYDPADPESLKAAQELWPESARIAFEKWGQVGVAFGDVEHDTRGPHLGNYQLWLRKIKKAFDPNIAADPSFYITPKE